MADVESLEPGAETCTARGGGALGALVRWETLLVVLLLASIAYGASVSPHFLDSTNSLLHRLERGRDRDHRAPADADHHHG